MPVRALAAALTLVAATPALAAPLAQPPTPAGVVRIPAPHGEVIIPSPGHQRAYDQIHYAPARRVGDMLYVSGVIVGRAPDEGTDAEAFKIQTRRAFKSLEATLRAAGAGFEDVVMINSFHVWEGPDHPAPRRQQLETFNAVKAEFMHAPHPAWTAVGTTGLLGEHGIVEVQLIAKLPEKAG